MPIPPAHSLVRIIPILSSLLKESIHDALVARYLDPTLESTLPHVAFLQGTEDPLCEDCADELAPYDNPDAVTYYSADAPYTSDDPHPCFVCSQRLYVQLTPLGAEAVILWSSNYVLKDNVLTDDDWLDVWLSTRDLDHEDPLWDHVSFILSSL